MAIIAKYIECLANRHSEGAIYRGHASEEWFPTPSAFRPPLYGIMSVAELDKWKEVAGRFAERGMSSIEWLVLAQHYGVPTPLLDWTTNPLVALFFACLGANNAENTSQASGAVLQISRDSLPQIPSNRNFDPFVGWSGQPMVVPADTMNRRSQAQDSVMTLHCLSNAEPLAGFNPKIFRVGPNDKADVLKGLRAFGITNDRIYADLNTAARDFQENLLQTHLNKILGPRQPFVDREGNPI